MLSLFIILTFSAFILNNNFKREKYSLLIPSIYLSHALKRKILHINMKREGKFSMNTAPLKIPSLSSSSRTQYPDIYGQLRLSLFFAPSSSES